MAGTESAKNKRKKIRSEKVMEGRAKPCNTASHYKYSDFSSKMGKSLEIFQSSVIISLKMSNDHSWFCLQGEKQGDQLVAISVI